MQGAFPVLGADWNAALDPGPDDAAQRQQRSDAIDRQLRELTRLRDGAAPAALPADPLGYVKVFPPTPSFSVDRKTFYILKEMSVQNEQARPGQWGQYLVTTVDIASRQGYARPIDVKIQIPTEDRRAYIGMPGTDPADSRLKPDPRYCILYAHYIVPNTSYMPPLYYEIGLNTLKNTLETAEALDLAFARRMEGLGNVAPQVCWDCLDPDYDPSDRPAVMDQFMAR